MGDQDDGKYGCLTRLWPRYGKINGRTAIFASGQPFTGLGHGLPSGRARYRLRNLTAKLIICLRRLPGEFELSVPGLNPPLRISDGFDKRRQFVTVKGSSALP